MSRFVRSHDTAWLSVRSVKSERTAAKQVVSEHAQGVHHREQLEDVRRVGLLGCRQLAALVRHGMVVAVVIRLGEHGRDGHLASIRGDDGAAP